MKKFKNLIKKIMFTLNILIFGLGSFLCFISAVVTRQDRLLVGGVLLLLLTFANQKIIYYIFNYND